MKESKQEILMHNILMILSEHEHISVKKVATLLNVGSSTVRRKVELINDVLKENDLGVIEKTPSVGLHLELKEEADIHDLFNNYNVKNIMVAENNIYIYLITILSQEENKITLSELSEKVYDSLPVVRKNIVLCKEWLYLFDIKLVIKQNTGITIIGNEENIRLAIKHISINNERVSLEENIRYFAKDIDIELLKKCIYKIESEWNFKFSEESFNSMLVYASLSIKRSGKTEMYISDKEIETVLRYNEYAWSKSLFNIIEKEFSVLISDVEIVYFAIQLLCSGLIHCRDIEEEENDVYKYDEKLKKFIVKIIAVISEVINVNLNDDKELYYGLLNHLRPAIFRMRFEKHSTTKLTEFVKEEYKQTYRVSWALSILFEEYYNINISSTELSYITLYIQASLDRLTKPAHLALVTELGMGLNQMFCNKIKIAIPRVEKIVIISLRDFDSSCLKDYDLIVTTSNLGIEDDKLVQVSTILNEAGIRKIRTKLDIMKVKRLEEKKKFDVSCHHFFDPKLIFTKLEISSKEDLLVFLSKKLVDYGYATPKYHSSILKREKTVSTYLGNGVAIPHGNSLYSNESKVVVAFLDKPVIWDSDNEVDVVFLLALRIRNAEESKQVQLFYKGFLDVIETDENLNNVKKLENDELYKYFIK